MDGFFPFKGRRVLGSSETSRKPLKRYQLQRKEWSGNPGWNVVEFSFLFLFFMPVEEMTRYQILSRCGWGFMVAPLLLFCLLCSSWFFLVLLAVHSYFFLKQMWGREVIIVS